MKTSTLLSVQIGVAVIAVAITLSMVMQIGPLTRKVDALHTQITELEAKRDELLLNNDRYAAVAAPAASAQSVYTAWVFVGRLNSSGNWAPPSDGVQAIGDGVNLNRFSQISVTKNSQLYESVESTTPSALTSGSSPNDEPASVKLVKAGAVLEVLDRKEETSVGGGRLVWVKVAVPPASLLSLSASHA